MSILFANHVSGEIIKPHCDWIHWSHGKGNDPNIAELFRFVNYSYIYNYIYNIYIYNYNITQNDKTVMNHDVDIITIIKIN